MLSWFFWLSVIGRKLPPSTLTRMAELHIEGLEGTAYTLIAYSKALKQKVRLVIWVTTFLSVFPNFNSFP